MEMYQAGASFYEQAPWFLLRSDHVIELRNVETNEHKVMQVCGNSFNDTGLMMWKSFRDFKRILVPGISQVDAIVKGQVYETLYYPEDEAEPEIKQQYRKHKYPTPVVGGVKFLADICLLAQRAPTPEEHFFIFNLSNILGTGKKATFLLKYPAEGKTIPYGERRLGPVPSAVDPIRAESIDEAHEYFKAKLAESEKKLSPDLFQTKGLLAKDPGGKRHLTYMKGFADTLWKLSQTDKAAELAYKMLWHDPGDEIEVTDMLVDFVLELGRFEEVMALLTRESFDSALVIWTSTLVDFVKYGGEHVATQKALLQALKHHPVVLSIIIGVKSLPRGMGELSSVSVGVSFSAQHGLQGDFVNAAHYCKNFAKYWRNVPGAVDWLKDYGLKLLAKLNEPGAKANMQPFPKPNLMVCFHCHTQKEKGLLKCSQCKRASYCNKECQKAHWKEHKPNCISLPSKLP